ncbi:MAG TPA: hypothetical protein PKX23_01370 [Verrucomicrobiota bacterium]|nr:hypothetical protein [Verrucomicrobiota bacterium]HRT06788.1 hypothetical protein [Candidatus Paceibacterota bacterium]HRT56328.1 hypothetical protein [Candidatus Paceibacterota bacterium]
MKPFVPPSPTGCALVASLLLGLAGCSKSSDEGVPSGRPPEPKAAASQLQQAFSTAPPEVKQSATTASEALRTADYSRAVQALQAIKARQNLSFEQGMAVHASELALEAKLIAGVEAGDPNAKRAYEALKRSRRQ